jgi:hypothetical protein
MVVPDDSHPIAGNLLNNHNLPDLISGFPLRWHLYGRFVHLLDKGNFLCILQENAKTEEGQQMMIRVIYKDQTAGVIESHLLDDLIGKGRIVAYHSVDRWVPVHSKAARSGTTLPISRVTSISRGSVTLFNPWVSSICSLEKLPFVTICLFPSLSNRF